MASASTARGATARGATVPTIQATQGINTGPSAVEPPDSAFSGGGGAAYAAGKGIQNALNMVASAADQRRQEEESIWVTNTAMAAHLKWEKYLAEQQASPDAQNPGFAGKMAEQFEKFHNEQIDNAPTASAQAALNARLNVLGQSVVGSSTTFEANAAMTRRAAELTKGIDLAAALAYRDGAAGNTNMDGLATETENQIKSTSLHPGTREALLKGTKEVVLAKMRGIGDTNPGTFIQMFNDGKFDGKIDGTQLIGLVEHYKAKAATGNSVARYNLGEYMQSALEFYNKNGVLPANHMERMKEGPGAFGDAWDLTMAKWNQEYNIAQKTFPAMQAIQNNASPAEIVSKIEAIKNSAQSAEFVGEPGNPSENFGNRFNSNQPKQNGFLGVFRVGGTAVSENSIGVQINGKETQIPTLVPGLTKEEVSSVIDNALSGGKLPLPPEVVAKAVAHAKERIAQGMDPFYNNSEGRPASFGKGMNITQDFQDSNTAYERMREYYAKYQAARAKDSAGVTEAGNPQITSTQNEARKQLAAGNVQQAQQLMDNAIQMSLTEQSRSGTPPYAQRVLSNSQAMEHINDIMKGGANSAVATFQQMKSLYGKNYGKVINDLKTMKDSPLPPIFTEIGDNLDNPVLTTELAKAALLDENLQKETKKGLLETVFAGKPADETKFKLGLDAGDMQNLKQSFMAGDNDAGLIPYENKKKAIALLAASYMSRGLSANDALAQAKKLLVTDKYYFNTFNGETYAVPRINPDGSQLYEGRTWFGKSPYLESDINSIGGTADRIMAQFGGTVDIGETDRIKYNMMNYTRVVANLPEKILPISQVGALPPGVSMEYARRQLRDNIIETGHWVTAPDDSGVILYQKVRGETGALDRAVPVYVNDPATGKPKPFFRPFVDLKQQLMKLQPRPLTQKEQDAIDEAALYD